MKKFIYKVGVGISSAALMAAMFAPSAFAADLEITDNGAGSTNKIEVTSTSNCEVKQTANTNVGALVGASANTGGNTANNNTGGSTSITTGNATATATVTVNGGSNTATDPCCCDSQCNGNSSPSAEIDNNGVGSNNLIKVTKTKNSKIRQRSNTNVEALVGAKAKTGKNKAKNNTGGSVDITTGNADSSADLTVNGGTNEINP